MFRPYSVGADRDRCGRLAFGIARRSHVPEISRGRPTVTSSLVKTLGASLWLSTMKSIVTRATVAVSHERATSLAIESQTSATFAQAAKSGPVDQEFCHSRETGTFLVWGIGVLFNRDSFATGRYFHIPDALSTPRSCNNTPARDWRGRCA